MVKVRVGRMRCSAASGHTSHNGLPTFCGSTVPPVGNPNQELPAASKIMPSQNVGMAQVISEKVSELTSIAVRRFHPANNPSATPSAIEKICPSETSSKVLPNFATNISATGSRCDHEMPRLPCAHWPIVEKY